MAIAGTKGSYVENTIISAPRSPSDSLCSTYWSIATSPWISKWSTAVVPKQSQVKKEKEKRNVILFLFLTVC